MKARHIPRTHPLEKRVGDERYVQNDEQSSPSDADCQSIDRLASDVAGAAGAAAVHGSRALATRQGPELEEVRGRRLRTISISDDRVKTVGVAGRRSPSASAPT